MYRLYDTDFIGNLNSDISSEQLIHVLKVLAEKYNLDLDVLENLVFKLSGNEIDLNIVDQLIMAYLGLENSPSTGNTTIDDGMPADHYLLNSYEPSQGTPDDSQRNEDSDELSLTTNDTFGTQTVESTEVTQTQSKHDQSVLLSEMGAFSKPVLANTMLLGDGQILSTQALPASSTADLFTNIILPEAKGLLENKFIIQEDVNVVLPNVVPIAIADTLGINQDGISANIYANVLLNDVDTDALIISSVNTAGTLGNVTFDQTTDLLTYETGNAFDYLGTGETATDVFAYTVDDGRGGFASASVTVTVTGSNDTPVANDDAAVAVEDAASINLHSLLLANDTDPDTSDVLDIISVDTSLTNGLVAFDNATNSLIYTAVNNDSISQGLTGTDTFTYTITDGNGGVSTATVTVTITGVNDAPVANDDSIAGDEDTVTTTSVFADNGSGADFDIDSADTITVSAVTGGVVGASIAGSAGGLFTIDADGTITFDPNGEFETMSTGDSILTQISYTITDDYGITDTATVTVTVAGVNDAPVANDDGIYGELDEGGFTYTISEADLMANDTDIEGDPLDIIAMNAGVGEGTLTDNGDGTWQYTAPADSLGFSGMSTITYTLSDGDLTDTATFVLRVFNVLIGTMFDDVMVPEDMNTPHKFVALDGNDVITGSNERDILIGGAGNDIMSSGSGDDDFVFEGTGNGVDTIDGGTGTDRVLGSTGDDTFSVFTFTNIEEINLGTGTDTLLGTTGNDTISFGTTTITDLEIIDGNGGTDIIVGSGYNDVMNFSNITTMTNITYIDSGAGNDTVNGSQSADTILVQAGNNTMYGEGGDDIFTVTSLATGTNFLDGGDGYDQVIATSGDDTLSFSALNNIEFVDLGTGTNIFVAAWAVGLDLSAFTSGTDILGLNYITDSSNRETVIATQGNDEIHMLSDIYTDTFRGEAGDDIFIFSGDINRNDTIDGGAGYDQIIGSAGDDSLVLDSLTGIEYIDLGAGTNYIGSGWASVLDLSSFTQGVDLFGLAYITDSSNSETVTGTDQSDEIRILTDNYRDTFNGGGGDDLFLFSGDLNRNDNIHGGAGYDQLIGSAGDDSLILGALTGIEFIDLGAGTNYMGAEWYGTLDLSAYTLGVDLLGLAYITDATGGETVTGTDQNDEIRMLSDTREDTFNGGGGDDLFLFSGDLNRNDNIHGGAGYDQLIGSAGDDSLILGALTGIEFIDLGAGTNYMGAEWYGTLDLSAYTLGVDLLGLAYITDATGGETVTGTDQNDEIRMLSDTRADTFNGGGGDDLFLFSGAIDRSDNIHGGAGYDQLIGSAGDDSLILGALTGIEFIDLGAGTNYMGAVTYGTLDLSGWTQGVDLLGLTYITDATGGETIIGTDQNDEFRMLSDIRTDSFSGGNGDDTFIFSGNFDRSDTVDGGAGYDQLLGSAGNDLLIMNNVTGIELIDLGTGTDYIQVHSNGTLDLSGWTQGVDLLGLDYLTDSTGTETLTGTAQDDQILMVSDIRTDTIYGGDGADTFILNAIRSTADNIADFDITENDAIDISQVLTYDSALGDLISDFVEFFDADGDSENGSGSVTLRIDADGTANGSNFTEYFVFDDQGMSMTDMISNGFLIVD